MTLFFHRRACANCGHSRSAHWIPFSYGKPCSLCACPNWRKR